MSLPRALVLGLAFNIYRLKRPYAHLRMSTEPSYFKTRLWVCQIAPFERGCVARLFRGGDFASSLAENPPPRQVGAGYTEGTSRNKISELQGVMKQLLVPFQLFRAKCNQSVYGRCLTMGSLELSHNKLERH